MLSDNKCHSSKNASRNLKFSALLQMSNLILLVKCILKKNTIGKTSTIVKDSFLKHRFIGVPMNLCIMYVCMYVQLENRIKFSKK